MERYLARRIAEEISNQQLSDMINAAKTGMTDWTKKSSCNRSFTKGVAWNILCKDFDINHKYHILAKTNMIREFGEFLPEELKLRRCKRPEVKYTHHDPIFD